MLYLVCVSLRGEEPMDFFSQLDRLGEVLQSFPGCFFSVPGIRRWGSGKGFAAIFPQENP